MIQMLAFIPALILVFGIGGCVAADGVSRKSPIAGHCDVVSTQMPGGGIQVEGRFTATQARSGTYDLSILDHGTGGLTTIRQTGRFAALTGETVTLGTARIGHASHVGATMVVTLDGGAVLSCGGLEPA